jgi:hypothetical protein
MGERVGKKQRGPPRPADGSAVTPPMCHDRAEIEECRAAVRAVGATADEREGDTGCGPARWVVTVRRGGEGFAAAGADPVSAWRAAASGARWLGCLRG